MRIIRFLKGLAVSTAIATIPIVGMESQQGTKIRIRAQDDGTLEGMKLTLTLPQPVNDGPEDDYIKMMVEESSQKAIKDYNGNFLEYKVSANGKIAPNVTLSLLTSPTGKWSQAEADVIIEPKGQKKQIRLKVQKKNNTPYYVTYEGFFYDIPNRIPKPPYPLEPLNKYGGTLQRRSVEEMPFPFFDIISAYGTIKYTFNTCENDICQFAPPSIKKRWENRGTTEVYPFMSKKQYLEIYPRENYEGLIGNAFYDKKDSQHILCFFPVNRINKNFTSQFADTLIHETEHNILDIMRPDIWDAKVTSSSLAAFHESFADIMTVFTLLTFNELNELVIQKTQGDLHHSSFLSVIGENIINRDAAGGTDLLAMPSCEEHDLSERLTRSVYGTLADAFWSRKLGNPDINLEKSKELLFRLSNNLRQLFLRTTWDFSIHNFTFAEFGRKMINLSWNTEGLSYFSGHILHAFGKQGIDLQDMSWKICISPNSSNNKKWKCSTLNNILNDNTNLHQIKILKETDYWYTRSFRPEPVKSKKTLAVIGKDDRTQVTDTNGDSWKVHGQLMMTFGSGKCEGTGTLISPWHVLTAGHNLYELDTGFLAESVIFYPGKNGKRSVAQPAKAIKWEVDTRYKEGKEEHDIGVILLDRPVGREVGWNGLLWAKDDILRPLSSICIGGYPGDKPDGTLWTASGHLDSISTSQFFYSIDTNHGESGSNLWVQVPPARLSLPKGFYSLGVHTYGEKKMNKATRLTQEKIDWLAEFINQR